MHKNEQNAANAVLTMLRAFAQQGRGSLRLASAKTQTRKASIKKLNAYKIQSNIILGYNFSRTLPKDAPQLFTFNDLMLAFAGRIHTPSKMANVPLLLKTRVDPEKIASTIVKTCDGAYAFAIAASDLLVVGRDVLGLAPLYFGKNDTLCAFASERKALWKLGLSFSSVKSFPPGSIGLARKDLSLSIRPTKTIQRAPPKPFEMVPAVKYLQKLLLQSMKNRVSGMKEVAVAFSGGLDSSLVAFLAQECGVKSKLITVGLENMPETRYAENAARALNMPTQVRTYSISDVEKTLPKVVWLIEESTPLNASIAIPLYWTAETAAEHGLNVLFAGQGADELFGGYHRYLNTYAEKGADPVQKTLFSDVVSCYATNFQRDTQTCAGLNVELRLPFADFRVVHFALSLPLSLKIESPTDKLRKRVLRKTAESLGLPEFIVNKAKKAVQYATGVDQVLRRLAKRENLTYSSYVRKVFREVFPDVKPDDQNRSSLHA